MIPIFAEMCFGPRPSFAEFYAELSAVEIWTKNYSKLEIIIPVILTIM